MDKKTDIIQENIHYENDSLFLFHSNFGSEGYPNHWHNAVEIIMPITHNYKVEVNRRIFEMTPGDIIIIPSGELHRIYEPESKGHQIIVQFSLEILNKIHGFINASCAYSSVRLLSRESDQQLHGAVRNLLQEMLDEYLKRDVHFEVALTHKIIGITLLLVRKYLENPEVQNENLSKRKMAAERLNECLDYINRNYNDKLTLETVAQAIGFSKYHFSRWFQENVNISFHDYLGKVRIERAETMLQSSTLTVTEIAMESGFQSTNTFNRLFKKYNNCTPTEYRYLNDLKKQASGGGGDEPAAAAITVKTPMPGGGFDIFRKPVPGHSSAEQSTAGEYSIPNNPLIWADIPDPDVIYANGAYYMSSTTMYFNPGIPIMKSVDLANWEIVSYAYDILNDSDACALRNGANDYGKGSWASSLRHHNGTFYVAAASPGAGKTYIFQTQDIENGPWHRFELDAVYHDCSMLFDDDGRVYMVYGGGTIRLIELTGNADAVLPGGVGKVIIEKANAGGDGGLPAEGSHIYKVGGRYYIFLIAWPTSGTKRRIQLCYRADSIEGPYEGRVVLDDDMGYGNRGVAQGGLIVTDEGSRYAMLFQDHGAVGRVPVLVPVTWEDGWPVFGVDGKVPKQLIISSKKLVMNSAGGGSPIVCSDEFYPCSVSKEFRACNTDAYRHGHLDEDSQSPQPLETTGETELLLNTDFEEDTAHWDVMEVAETMMTGDELYDGSPVLFVTGRATTASGPRQMITGKVRHGGIYETYARVMYTEGPPVKVFNVCMRSGSSWEGIRIIATGRLQKGVWGTLRGTYTLPASADLSETSVFVETPWVEKPKKDTDLMDFYVSHVSVVSIATPVRTATDAGENDPRGSALALAWQWNHNPDHNLWSLDERPGFLRLRSAYLSHGLLDARNTLTQRTFGPRCSGVTALDTAGMKDGDTAGLAALQEKHGYIAVKVINNERYIIMVSAADDMTNDELVPPHMLESSRSNVRITQQRVYLCAQFDFEDSDTARFYYSLDELSWHPIGDPLPMEYTLAHFTGYRFALFYFATQAAGGYADFDYFRVSGNLLQNDDSPAVLKASLTGSEQVPGVLGARVKVSVSLDEPGSGQDRPEEGIYLSFPVPAVFDVEDVEFCKENISGDTSCRVENRQLHMSVKRSGGNGNGDGSSGSSGGAFSHNVSGKLADIFFTVNTGIKEDTVCTLRPDYIYAAGCNAAYCIHDADVRVQLLALSDDRNGHGGLSAADINDGDYVAVPDVDFGNGGDTLCFFARAEPVSPGIPGGASGDGGGCFEIRLGSMAGETIGTLAVGGAQSEAEQNGWEVRSSTYDSIKGSHTLYFIYRGGSGQKVKLDYWRFND